MPVFKACVASRSPRRFASGCSAYASAQTLTIGVRAGPESIDPHYTATGTHAEALKHVFDTLVWSGDKLQLEPRPRRDPGRPSTRPPGSSSCARA